VQPSGSTGVIKCAIKETVLPQRNETTSRISLHYKHKHLNGLIYHTLYELRTKLAAEDRQQGLL